MTRKTRLPRLTRRQSRHTVRSVAVLTGERVSNLADPRLWPNAVQIARGLSRPESTVRDALGYFLRLSRAVGRERRYPWPVTFELAHAYAVPPEELSAWAIGFLEAVARERDIDPRDLFDLYRSALDQWRRGMEQPSVSHSPWRPRHVRRLSEDVVSAERAVIQAEGEPQVPPPGPQSVPLTEWEQARANSA